jgi:hypothetical protein
VSESVVEMEARLIQLGERLLGKMLQNAKALGLKPATRLMYSDSNGKSTDEDNAAACCALGAAFLTPDACSDVFNSGLECFGAGNDDCDGSAGRSTAFSFDDPHVAVGYTVGAAFQHAMGARGRR